MKVCFKKKLEQCALSFANSFQSILYNWASQMVLEVNYSPANAGDIRDEGSIPGLGKSPGGGHGNPLQYSCLENRMDQEPGRL